jgi:hypothetical protein
MHHGMGVGQIVSTKLRLLLPGFARTQQPASFGIGKSMVSTPCSKLCNTRLLNPMKQTKSTAVVKRQHLSTSTQLYDSACCHKIGFSVDAVIVQATPNMPEATRLRQQHAL